MTEKTQSRKTPAPNSKAPAKVTAPKAGAETSASPAIAPAAKAESKTEKVIALLQRTGGVTLGELVAATDWQPHTTRAALTGLKKKGHIISSEKVDGVRRYRAHGPQ